LLYGGHYAATVLIEGLRDFGLSVYLRLPNSVKLLVVRFAVSLVLVFFFSAKICVFFAFF